MMKSPGLLVLLVLLAIVARSQDTLPNFSATTRGNNRTIIGWTNNYPVVKQISIQRSLDSTKNFKTILTVPDPTIPQNGFVDTKAPTPFVYYRLFILLDSNKYVFSRSKKAVWDTTKVVVEKSDKPVNGSKQVVVSGSMTKQDVEELKEKLEEIKTPPPPAAAPKPEKFFVVIRRDSLLAPLAEKNYKKFRDSVVNKTKDTMLFNSVDTILIRPFVPKEIYRPSKFVYTERDGNISISLPEALSKTFSIKFFEDDNSFLFEIRHVKETFLTLDKANFLHAGWFRFELYEDGKLKEKHRLFIPKEF